MSMILLYLKSKRVGIAIYCLSAVLFLVSFLLYRLPVQAVLYPIVLSMLLGAAILTMDYFRQRKKYHQLSMLMGLSAELIDELPEAESMTEEAYGRLIEELKKQQRTASEQASEQYRNMMDYFTTWAHQIKTPIASMRLNLQNEDLALSRTLRSELSRIEQYADMVLTFLRLDSNGTDYIIREYDLDTIVRSAVRRFSSEFILKKLRLEYEPIEGTVLTDEKWLLFVIEQVLSNALKYTPAGTISIYCKQPDVLCIRDTGIGIAPEDIPRIFENGFTGFNGRQYQKATGIGLYLCKRICDNLGHAISACSEIGVGTEITIDLRTQKRMIE